MYQPGENFTGRYELIDHLGTGGFGEVWKSYDHTIEEHVALKIVGGGSQISRDLVKACSDEYKATLKIHHTHLLTPQYFDIYQGRMYLVMRLCEGGSLASHLLRNTLAEEEVHRLIRELGSALAHLHRSGLLHNDIKPDNILLEKPLSEGGSFLLTDFGISTRLRSSVRKSTGADKDMKGMTHAYSAPELFGSQPKQTPATDVFSFGVMLYECCVGDVPWMGAGGVVLNTGAVVPDIPDTYSPALRQLVSFCMSLDPAQRPDAGALSGFEGKAEPQPEKRSTQQQERKTVKQGKDKAQKVWQPAGPDPEEDIPEDEGSIKKPSSAWVYGSVLAFLILGVVGFWLYRNDQIKQEKELAAWEKAAGKNDSTAYASYLELYPDALHSEEAKEKLDSIVEKRKEERAATLARKRKEERAAALARKREEERVAKQKKLKEWTNKGNQYYNDEDYTGAVYWYRKAAEQGYTNGQYNLGHMYHNGYGVAKDYKSAVYWYEKACENGSRDACYYLDNMKYFDIKLKSECYEKIYVAINYEDDNGDRITRGWWHVEPYSSIYTDVKTRNRNIYFYAYSTSMSWNGEYKSGSIEKKITSDPFILKNNVEVEYWQSNVGTVSFFRREAASYTNEHTQSFSCN